MEFQALPHPLITQTFGRPAEELIRLADAHTMAVQRWLASRSPQAAILEGRGVCASSTGLAVPLLNLALGARFPDGDAEMVDAEIEAVIAFFERRGVPWRWWLGPCPRPPDMAERLRRYGLVPRERTLPALAARLPAHVPPPPPHIVVWQAADRADLEAASYIRRIAFRFPPGMALDYFQSCADDWLGGRPPMCARLFLARLQDGPPAAIGAVVMGAGYPGVYVMATLPEWQRRGLGRAIMAQLMQTANATGCDLAFLTASPFGYPLYRQFGFEHIFDYRIFYQAEP